MISNDGGAIGEGGRENKEGGGGGGGGGGVSVLVTCVEITDEAAITAAALHR